MDAIQALAIGSALWVGKHVESSFTREEFGINAKSENTDVVKL
jgi:hypothetical protein